MILKKVINESWYGSIGYISNESSIELLGSYLLYNSPLLNEYKGHIFAFTYDILNKSLLESTIKSIFPEAVILYLEKNRGHNFGNADLDNIIFNYCNQNNIEWLCKSASDIILQPEMLDISIKDADFYYMNGIGLGGMEKYNFDNKRIINEDFFPQTNFYFINISKIDYINDQKYLDETYNYIQSLDNYNGKIWEYIEGWECEGFLRECVNRNKLSKYHLVPQKTYIKLLELIKYNQIHDCSHKNIMIDGICHFQYPNQPIIAL